ncbi:MAG: hypothetical protein LBP88_04065 [Treponema sp.]|nr:hypothetical protein [Treponema sp.]
MRHLVNVAVHLGQALTSRKRGVTMERVLKELTMLILGWLGYCRIADMKKYVRQIYWK